VSKFGTSFRDWRPEVLILDEAHRIKSPASRTGKALRAIPARYRYALTGSPVLKNYLDMWAILSFLGVRGVCERFSRFRAHFFVDKNRNMPRYCYFPKWEPDPARLPELTALIAEYCSIAHKADCLDLPPLVKKIHEVPLAPEVVDVYRGVAKDFIAAVEAHDGSPGVVTAQLAMVKALRLLQLSHGVIAVQDEAGATTARMARDCPRLDALMALIADIAPSDKILVWVVWRAAYPAIAAALTKAGIGHVVVTGDTPQDERQAAVDRFQTDESCRVFVGHPRSAGIGVNLTAASVSIVHSRSFRLEDDIQAEGRNYRGGSERHTSITRYDLVTPDTLDAMAHEVLAARKVMGTDLLRRAAKALLQKGDDEVS
jgi:SNF2 family DNA or RNA helicase